MAGDIEEPFRLSFQVDSIHSGSISFGRFELESLSWERRSSFSHNRYLEDVEKYARPGSVTEKKAYFEAHFRRKALLRQAEQEASASENGSYETPTYHEENNYHNWSKSEEAQDVQQDTDVCHFDESSEGGSSSYCYGDVSEMQCEKGLTSYVHSESVAETIDVDVDIVSQFDESSDEATAEDSNLQLESGVDSVILENAVGCCDNKEMIPNEDASEGAKEGSMDSRLEAIQASANLDSADSEEIIIQCCENEANLKSESERHNDAVIESVENDVPVILPNGEAQEMPREECISRCTETQGAALKMLQICAPKSRVEENTRASSVRTKAQNNASLTHRLQVKKGTAPSSSLRERQTPLRTRTPNSIPQSTLRVSKKENPQSSKAKPVQENRSEKDVKPKRGVTLQPSTPERTESRRPPSAPGIKRIAPTTNKEIKRCGMNTSFRSERGEKTKEIKKYALNSSLRSEREPKIKQPVKNSTTFKAKPMPSFYHRPVTPVSSGNKPQEVPNRNRPSKAPGKSVCVGKKTGEGSMPSSKTVNTKPIISPSKYEGVRSSLGSKNSDVHSNPEARRPSNIRNLTARETKPKSVARRK